MLHSYYKENLALPFQAGIYPTGLAPANSTGVELNMADKCIAVHMYIQLCILIICIQSIACSCHQQQVTYVHLG